MSAQYRQIGNAVPVPLAKAVAEAFTAPRPRRAPNLDYRIMLDAAVHGSAHRHATREPTSRRSSRDQIRAGG